MEQPQQLDNVSVVCKANIFFDGKVVSHTVLTKKGKRTLGIIFPGSYNFNTGQPERMDIIAGQCRVRLKGEPEYAPYGPGMSFSVPANSAFEIAVDEGLAEYVCTFE